MANDIEQVVVRIIEDTASANKLERRITSLRIGFKRMGKEARKSLLIDVVQSTNKATDAQKRLNSEIDRTRTKRKQEGRETQAGRLPGVLGRGSEGVARFGRGLRAAPAIPLGGITTEPISKVITALGSLGVGVAGLGVAAIAAVPAVLAINEVMQRLTKDLQGHAEATAALLDIIDQDRQQDLDRQDIVNSRTGEANRKLADDQLRTVDAIEADLDRVTALRDEAKSNIFIGGGRTPADILKARDDLGKFNDKLVELRREFVLASDAFQETVNVVGPLIDEEDQRRLVEQRLAEQSARVTSEAERRLQEDIKIAKASEQTTDAIKAMIEQNKNEIAAREDAITAIQESGVETDEARLAIEKYSDAIRFLRSEQERLNNEALPAANQREAIEAEQKRRQDLADATQRYNDDLQSIEEDAIEARLNLHEKYNQSLEDIAQKAADSAEDALRQLQSRRAALARDLGRDEVDAQRDFQLDLLDTQIEFQRDEARAAREHADRIIDIRRKGQLDETRAIEDRDAVSLLRALAQTSEAIGEAQRQAQNDRRERLIAFQNQRADLHQAFIRERQARLVQHQRRLEDVQIAFEQERQQIEINRQRQLRDLNASHTRELAQINAKEQAAIRIRQQAIKAELKLVAAGQQARLKQEAAFQRALVAQAKAILRGTASNIGNTKIPTFHNGGVMPRDGLAMLKRGEVVTNPARGQSAPGGINLNINFQGATTRTITAQSRKEVSRYIDQMLLEAGAA